MEDYKKKYEEALERARGLHEQGMMPERIEYIFPELKESEDERIRKEIIQFLQLPHPQFVGKRNHEEWIAWLEAQGKNEEINEASYRVGIKRVLDNPESYGLEKQGEKIDAIENFDTEFEKQVSHIIASAINKEHEYNEGFVKWSANALLNYAKHELKKQGEQKPVDKVEPKFKAGNWYLCVKDFYGKGVRFDKGRAYYCKLDGCLQEFDTGAHIAMDESLYDYFNLWNIQDAKDGDVLHKVGFSSDCIFIFNSIEDGRATAYCCIDVSSDKIEFGIQGPDNIEFNNITPATTVQRDLLFQKMKEAGYEWDAEKKELRKIEQKPAWSEEDEKMIDTVIYDLERHGGKEDSSYLAEINFLNSLKERYTWKPSDEMLEALYKAVPDNVKEMSEDEMLLDKLYQGLKYGRVLSEN